MVVLEDFDPKLAIVPEEILLSHAAVKISEKYELRRRKIDVHGRSDGLMDIEKVHGPVPCRDGIRHTACPEDQNGAQKSVKAG